jgi:hypothetical protein
MAGEVKHYRDLKVTPGCQLYKALEDKDMKLAARIYDECEAEFRKYFPTGKILPTQEDWDEYHRKQESKCQNPKDPKKSD